MMMPLPTPAPALAFPATPLASTAPLLTSTTTTTLTSITTGQPERCSEIQSASEPLSHSEAKRGIYLLSRYHVPTITSPQEQQAPKHRYAHAYRIPTCLHALTEYAHRVRDIRYFVELVTCPVRQGEEGDEPNGDSRHER